jgi:hypothetical protein
VKSLQSRFNFPSFVALHGAKFDVESVIVRVVAVSRDAPEEVKPPKMRTKAVEGDEYIRVEVWP